MTRESQEPDQVSPGAALHFLLSQCLGHGPRRGQVMPGEFPEWSQQAENSGGQGDNCPRRTETRRGQPGTQRPLETCSGSLEHSEGWGQPIRDSQPTRNYSSQCTWITQVQEHCLLPLHKLEKLMTYGTQNTQRAGLSSGKYPGPGWTLLSPKEQIQEARPERIKLSLNNVTEC